MMEEILIPFGDKLYSLEPNWANQDWRYGILETEEGPYSGTWWQMDAVDANGDTYSVVFIQADSKPDNAVDLDIPETRPGEMPTYPTEADGYYPVKVETGLNDAYNVEIKSGLNGDETVFVQFYNDNQMYY